MPASALGFSPRLMRYYLPDTLSETNFNGGICRDVPPTSIPPGFCYDDVDFNLDQPGLAYFRGPIKEFGEVFGGSAGFTAADWLAAALQADVTRVLVQWNGSLWWVQDGIAAVNCGAMDVFPIDRPKVYPNNGTDILVVTDKHGTVGPSKVTIASGTPVPGTLGGNPPTARLSCVHQNWLALGSTEANPNRIYFSPSTSIEDDWTAFPSFIDTTYPLTALASVQGVLLAFSHDYCERIIGDVPPNNPGENMTLQSLGATGCTAPLSIQPWGANIVFINPKGVYVTNGAGFDSLTDKANGTGIGQFWQALTISNYGEYVGAGIYNQKYYIVSLGGGQENLVCFLPTKSWWRVSTLSFLWADTSPDILGRDEMYHVGLSYPTLNQVYACSKMFQPIGAGADDVPFSGHPSRLTTRMIGDGLGLKAYEHGHMTLSTPGGVQLGFWQGVGLEQMLEGFGPNLVPEQPFFSGATTGSPVYQRKRFSINRDAQGIYYNLSKYAGGSLVETQLLAIESEVREATYGPWSDAVYP
jgi:hypothetical protein